MLYSATKYQASITVTNIGENDNNCITELNHEMYSKTIFDAHLLQIKYNIQEGVPKIALGVTWSQTRETVLKILFALYDKKLMVERKLFSVKNRTELLQGSQKV